MTTIQPDNSKVTYKQRECGGQSSEKIRTSLLPYSRRVRENAAEKKVAPKREYNSIICGIDKDNALETPNSQRAVWRNGGGTCRFER